MTTGLVLRRSETEDNVRRVRLAAAFADERVAARTPKRVAEQPLLRVAVRARHEAHQEEEVARQRTPDFELAARVQREKAKWGVISALVSAVVVAIFVLGALMGPVLVAKAMRGGDRKPPAIEKVERPAKAAHR